MQALPSPIPGIAARAGARIAAWLLLGACAQAAAEISEAPAAADDAAIQVSPQARALGLADAALPALSQQLIDTFMVEPEVLTEAEIERSPRLVAAAHARTLLSAGDRVYARGGAGPALRMRSGRELYRIFRDATPLTDPETGDLLGYEAQYLGKARLLRGESTLAALDAEGRLVASAAAGVVPNPRKVLDPCRRHMTRASLVKAKLTDAPRGTRAFWRCASVTLIAVSI